MSSQCRRRAAAAALSELLPRRPWRHDCVGLTYSQGAEASSAQPSQSRHDQWRILQCALICIVAIAIMRTQGGTRDRWGTRLQSGHSGAGVNYWLQEAGAPPPQGPWPGPDEEATIALRVGGGWLVVL